MEAQFYKIHLQAFVKDCIFRTIPLTFWSGASDDGMMKEFPKFFTSKANHQKLNHQHADEFRDVRNTKKVCIAGGADNLHPTARLAWHTQHVTDAHETWGIMSPQQYIKYRALKNE
jgi:hypothetical protein